MTNSTFSTHFSSQFQKNVDHSRWGFDGFLLFCCYNTHRRFGGDPENPSGSLASSSASNNNARRGLGLSCLFYDEITQRNSDLPLTALAVQREQQLRQIKLEINELSHRLGIGQLYRGRQYIHIPIPMTRPTLIQPDWTCRRSRIRSRTLVSQLEGTGDDEISNDNNNGTSSSVNLLEMSFFSSPPDNETTVDQTLTDRNAIFLERERRLRLIRMENLTLQLQLSSLSEDRSMSETNPAGCSISSSDLEGLVFEPDSEDSEENDCDGGFNSCSVYLDKLPSYDESIVAEMDESPPPSYAQCSHLYSFEGDGLSLNREEYYVTSFRNNLSCPHHQHPIQNQPALLFTFPDAITRPGDNTTDAGTGGESNRECTTACELILSDAFHAQDDHIHSDRNEEEVESDLDLDLDLDQPPPPSYDECVPG